MAKKSGKKPKEVKVVADGTERVVLVFPKGTWLKLKKGVSYDALAKVLGTGEKQDEVEGQQHCCLTAMFGAVRG